MSQLMRSWIWRAPSHGNRQGGARIYLLAIYDAGCAYRWNVRPSSWARHACTVAGRRLTRSEWEDALPERDYDPAC